MLSTKTSEECNLVADFQTNPTCSETDFFVSQGDFCSFSTGLVLEACVGILARVLKPPKGFQ